MIFYISSFYILGPEAAHLQALTLSWDTTIWLLLF